KPPITHSFDNPWCLCMSQEDRQQPIGGRNQHIGSLLAAHQVLRILLARYPRGNGVAAERFDFRLVDGCRRVQFFEMTTKPWRDTVAQDRTPPSAANSLTGDTPTIFQ